MSKNYFNTLSNELKLEELGTCRFMQASEFDGGSNAAEKLKIVIIGCGAQGLNQGLNMRDSGLDISYALRNSAIIEKRQSFLKKKVGIRDIRLAFPHLSPKPFIVPCTCLTPAWTATKLLATAFSVSLCAWMPKFFPGICFVTSSTILDTSWGKVPPFVSQRTIHLAP